jgi:hypothetical protein
MPTSTAYSTHLLSNISVDSFSILRKNTYRGYSRDHKSLSFLSAVVANEWQIDDPCFSSCVSYLKPACALIKKIKKIFHIYKEIQSGAVAKSYMRKGFQIFLSVRRGGSIENNNRVPIFSFFLNGF